MPVHILFSPDIFALIDQVQPSSRGELEFTDALECLFMSRTFACISNLLLDRYRLSMGYA